MPLYVPPQPPAALRRACGCEPYPPIPAILSESAIQDDLTLGIAGIINESRLLFPPYQTFSGLEGDYANRILLELTGIGTVRERRVVFTQRDERLFVLDRPSTQIEGPLQETGSSGEGGQLESGSEILPNTSFFVSDPVAQQFYHSIEPSLGAAGEATYQSTSGGTSGSAGTVTTQPSYTAPPSGATAPTDPGEFYGGGYPNIPYPDASDYYGLGFPGGSSGGPIT